MSEEIIQESAAKAVLKDVREIKIGDRVRQLVGDPKKKQGSSDIRDMAISLEENGQIQPIVVDNNELVAGFRRLTGAAILLSEGKQIGAKLPELIDEKPNPRRLPPGKILAIEYNDMTPMERLRMEIEENVARKQFTSAEQALGYDRLKKMMETVEGRVVSTKEVAKAAKVSRAQVTMGLKVAEAVQQGSTHLLQSNSVIAAYNRLNSEKKIQDLKDRLIKTNAETPNRPKDTLEQQLFHGDGIEWLKSLANESVDFVNFDPPWGVDIDSYDRWNAYEKVGDDEVVYTYKSIIEPMIPELFRVMKTDTYMIVWFGIQFYDKLSSLLLKAGFKVRPVPSIWFKTNKAGSQSDSTRIELNVYEPFFICEKGSPRLFKNAQKNVYAYPMPTQRIHLNQKDVDMLVDVLERYTYGNMMVIDPTFGSGSIFRAAQRLGRKFAGAEKNEENHKKALQWLRIGVIQ